MLFPHLTPFAPGLRQTILERAGNNLLASQLLPWMRVSASTGLTIESIPFGDSFSTRYGGMERSGRVGSDFLQQPIYADGSDRAFRPSPIIESLAVTFGTGGLTRTCKFDIKCFTLPQAEKVMEYFLEPGYTVLVEYGWNTTFGVGQKDYPLDACAIAKFNSYDHIKKKQHDSRYQYDGFMGYITNGGFQSGDGETYSISVELTSIGEVAAYLQQHRGGSTLKDKSSSGGKPFELSTIDAISKSDVGLSLFMQMYNRLPLQKQTVKVKNLINGVDTRGNKWTSAPNFINMDDEIRSLLLEVLQDATAETEEGSAEIPEGAPLISELSYIRLELAFEILKSYSIDLKSSATKCGLATYNSTIEYRNTIIRGHKYMFSHDGSKLFIPNPTAPDFGLVQALTTTDPIDINSIITNGIPTNTVNLAQFTEKEYQFPQQQTLNAGSHTWPTDVLPFDAGPGQWGYLKDLYINFEFFIEILERSNFVAKDVYYEILNGISSAANSMWHFEIVQLPSTDAVNKDQYQLEIVDLNFQGSANFIPSKFRASGVDTPFIESSLSFDIPAAMKNMIVAERTAGQPDVSSEGPLPVKTGGLFSKKQDPVIAILSAFEKEITDIIEEPEIEEPADPEPPSEEDIRKQNYELFMSKATVLPSIKDRNGNLDAVKNKFLDFFGFTTTDTTLEELLVVGAWSDPSLLRKLDLNTRNSTTANNILLEIKFQFKIHGVSGIKSGDIFEIEDLPKNYKDGLFQVVEVSHECNNNMWTTSVTGQYRKKDETGTSIPPVG
jgi:hypothetical protein